MDLWFNETQSKHTKFSVQISQHLYSNQSEYQKIDVFSSFEFGTLLVLDGKLVVCEKDEFIYNEMLTHVGFAMVPTAKRILVIGSGHGGVVKEVIKYPGVCLVDVVELDACLREVAQQFFPSFACAFMDERVVLHHCDALKFLRNTEQTYDLIIVDAVNAQGANEILYTKEFYGMASRRLSEAGMLINQHETSYYSEHATLAKAAFSKLSAVFANTSLYQATIPTFPAGSWMFGCASKQKKSPVSCDWEWWSRLEISTHYYNPEVHVAAFALPNYIRKEFQL
ncbi:MAG: polyamine aminopropyltransferase [Erysipelotrichaceae bacterium]